MHQPVQQPRGDREVVDLLRLDHREQVPGRRIGQHQPGAGGQAAAEHGVESVRVEEGQHPEDDAVGVDDAVAADLLEVGQQRAVAEHHGLRVGAGAEGGGDDRERLHVRRGGHLGRGRGQRGETLLAQLERRDPFVGGAASGGQHRARSAGGQQAVALVGRLVGIGRYDDEAGPQSSEVGDHPGDGVTAVETDPLTGEQTGAHEAAGNRVDPTVQLGPADRTDPRLHEGEPVRQLFGLESGEQGQVAEEFDPGGTRVCSVGTKIRRVLGLGGDHGSSLTQADLVPPASDRRPVGLRAPGIGWRTD